MKISYRCSEWWSSVEEDDFCSRGVRRAEAFIPNPQNKREVNHIDGNKSNNAVWNLEWTTTSENARHSVRVGLRTQCKSVRIVETGEVFPSLGECARAIGGDVGNISRCLNTDKSDTHKGFHFERVV